MKVIFAALTFAAFYFVAVHCADPIYTAQNDKSSGHCIIGKMDVGSSEITQLAVINAACELGAIASTNFGVFYVAVTFSNGSNAIITLETEKWTQDAMTIVPYQVWTLHHIFWFGTTHLWGIWYNTDTLQHEVFDWNGYEPEGPELAMSFPAGYKSAGGLAAMCGSGQRLPALSVQLVPRDGNGTELFLVDVFASPVTASPVSNPTTIAAMVYSPVGVNTLIPVAVETDKGVVASRLDVTSGEVTAVSSALKDSENTAVVANGSHLMDDETQMYFVLLQNVISGAPVLYGINWETGSVDMQTAVPKDITNFVFQCCA